ncbi:MAG: EamA family transporter [Acidimicrobiales bacterium]
MIALVFAALSGLSYGASDFSGGLAAKHNDAVVVTIAVQLVSVVSLGLILALSAPATVTPADLAWGGLGGLGAMVGLTTFYRALADGPMTTAASVTGLVGSLVPVVTGLTLGEVPNNITLAGIGLAIPAGIVVSAGGIGSTGLPLAVVPPRVRARRRYDIAQTRRLSVVAGCGFGLFFVALAQVSSEAGLYPLVGARAASVIGLALVLTATHRWAVPHRADWVAIAVAGVLDCGANSFYLLALTDASFTWVAAVVSLYPVATVLLARALLAERIVRIQVAGLVGAASALVLVGVGAT